MVFWSGSIGLGLLVYIQILVRILTNIRTLHINNILILICTQFSLSYIIHPIHETVISITY